MEGPRGSAPGPALRKLDAVVGAAAALVLVASTALICCNVFYRYVVLGWLRSLGERLGWADTLYRALDSGLSVISVTADEVPGYLLVWLTFLGAYLAARQGGHIAFDLMVDKLPDRGRRLAKGLIDGAIIAFLIVLLVQSIRMIRIDGATEIETAAIAQGWFMSILPISAALLILALLIAIAQRRTGAP